MHCPHVRGLGVCAPYDDSRLKRTSLGLSLSGTLSHRFSSLPRQDGELRNRGSCTAEPITPITTLAKRVLLFILHRFYQDLDVCIIACRLILRLISAFSLLLPIIRLLRSAMVCRSEVTLYRIPR